MLFALASNQELVSAGFIVSKTHVANGRSGILLALIPGHELISTTFDTSMSDEAAESSSSPSTRTIHYELMPTITDRFNAVVAIEHRCGSSVLVI